MDVILEVILWKVIRTIATWMRATGTVAIRAVSFGRIRTAPVFPDVDDPTPLIGTTTWDGKLVAGPWISFLVGLMLWIMAVIAIALLT